MRRRKGAPERREEPEEEQPWRDRAVKGGRMGGGGGCLEVTGLADRRNVGVRGGKAGVTRRVWAWATSRFAFSMETNLERRKWGGGGGGEKDGKWEEREKGRWSQ